jgi:hypothetical protein
MFLVQVIGRKKRVLSRGEYQNEDAEIVGLIPAVINHRFFCEERKTPPNQDVVKHFQSDVQLILRG